MSDPSTPASDPSTPACDLSAAISDASPEPPFEQLKGGIRERVDSGALRAGDRLPTVRALATHLGLAPNTVARAYRELEAVGLLDTRGRSGTFVAGDLRERSAREAAAECADRMRALGVAPDRAVELLRASLGP